MRKNTRDLTGDVYGNLTVVSKAENIGGKVAWNVVCKCGVEKAVISTNLVGGKVVSCGCSRVTHNLSLTPEYHVWYSMIDRCTNVKHRFYGRYGGRGICVDPQWLNLDKFILDMGERPSDKHQLDRINNDAGYSKGNCRWVLSVTNSRNRNDSKYWHVDGVRYESMRHAALENGVAHSTIKNWCSGGKDGCYSERKYK